MLKRLRDTEFADRASDIRGSAVYGANNEKIGTIEDVIFDSESEVPPYAIIDAGSWLKSRRFLVPSNYIRTHSTDQNAFTVPMTREQVQQLPEFDDNLLSDERSFTEYEARYRPQWTSYGFEVPESRHSRIRQFEESLRSRNIEPARTSTRDVRSEPARTASDDRRIESPRTISSVPVTTVSGTAAGESVSVYGVYHDQNDLEKAVDRLKQAGFSSNDISVVFPDKNRSDQFAMERNTKAPEGAATGGGTGLVVGGVLGWLAGIGTLAIPGIGPLLAAGPIVAALAGAGVGGAVGGIAGGLIGLGMPEVEAKRYEKEIKEGRMLMSVRCADPRFAGTARSIMSDTNARDVFETGERKAA